MMGTAWTFNSTVACLLRYSHSLWRRRRKTRASSPPSLFIYARKRRWMSVIRSSARMYTWVYGAFFFWENPTFLDRYNLLIWNSIKLSLSKKNDDFSYNMWFPQLVYIILSFLYNYISFRNFVLHPLVLFEIFRNLNHF